jgi:hypothetical protein
MLDISISITNLGTSLMPQILLVFGDKDLGIIGLNQKMLFRDGMIGIQIGSFIKILKMFLLLFLSNQLN